MSKGTVTLDGEAAYECQGKYKIGDTLTITVQAEVASMSDGMVTLEIYQVEDKGYAKSVREAAERAENLLSKDSDAPIVRTRSEHYVG